tara:strand:- start:151 stop:333 length:183 start_codon:yes stop_codon:yes gene_type:complete
MKKSKNQGLSWDGKSRPVTEEYRDSWNRIFGVKSKDDVKHDHVNKDHANKKETNENKNKN